MENPTEHTEAARAAIAMLHARESGDWQTLLRQAAKVFRPVQYNVAQLAAATAPGRDLYLEWGRGAGKTTYIGHRLREIVLSMPRSTGLFIAPTYQFTLTRILPSLIAGLEKQGIFQNLHYFIATEPPRSWRDSWGRAYQPPKRFDKYISFWNGAGIHLISQDNPGDGRGLNTDWILSDEAGLLDYDKLRENTDPTLRGSDGNAFKKARFWGSKMYCTSTPITKKGKWFTEMEGVAVRENAEAARRKEPLPYTFLRASCRVNLHNLMPGYLETAEKESLNRMLFEAEYLNIRPRNVLEGFYPLLDEARHGYNAFNYNFYTRIGQAADCRGDADLDPAKPITLGVDWGATINCAVACQQLPGEFRALKNFYVLGERQEVQSDLFQKFHEYYRHHPAKTVRLWYDHSGNVQTGITKSTRAQLAREQLLKLGWQVQLMTTGGANPRHELKHVLWNNLLEEKDPRLPRFRLNLSNCRELWISMQHAEAKLGRGSEMKKNKGSERSTTTERQFATDLSDAMDTAVYGLFSPSLTYRGGGMPEIRAN